MGKRLVLTATPEREDFEKKYEETGMSGAVGKILINRYFSAVEKLLEVALFQTRITSALEVGAGAGHSSKRLYKICNQRNIKFEASEFVPALVKKLEQEADGRFAVQQESVYELQRADKSFDLVFLPEVLEHLDYPDKALAEIKRVSNYLILGVPHEPIWRILNMLRFKYLSDFGNTPGHLNNWSSRGVQRVVGNHYGEVIAIMHPLPWTLLLAKAE